MIDYSFPLEELEFFLFILVRISCFVFVAPIFSDSNVPRYTKAAISVFVAIIMYSIISPRVYPEYDSILGFASVVILEAVVGLVIGLGANLCMMIVSFGGHLVDVEIGFSMASVMDPSTRQSITLTGLLYQYTFMLIFLLTGMHTFFLQALADTFELIPVGGAHPSSNDMYDVVLDFATDYIIIGFRIALPVFCTILLVNGILGVMAKVSPQMNMFAVGMQIKVLCGMAALFFTVSLMPKAADFIFTQMRVIIVAFVKALGG